MKPCPMTEEFSLCRLGKSKMEATRDIGQNLYPNRTPDKKINDADRKTK